MPAWRQPRVGSTFACLVNISTGDVLFERRKDDQHKQSSTTKLTTSAVAAQHIVNWATESYVVTSTDAAVTGTTANLVAGDRLTLRDLLRGALYPSGNDAANGIANYVGGAYLGGNGTETDNVAKFVAAMNAFASANGFTNSHYANPHGMDATGHYTSAYDLARIAGIAATFGEIVMTGTDGVWTTSAVGNPSSVYTWPAQIPNYQKIPGFLIGKAGQTPGAIAEAMVVERDGVRLAAAIIEEGTATNAAPFATSLSYDLVELFLYGFRQLGITTEHMSFPEDGSFYVNYSGTWAGTWPPAPDKYRSGFATTSATAGSKANWYFYGRAVSYRTWVGPDQGQCRISIDDIVEVATQDNYSPTGASFDVFVKRFPVDGWHRITVEVLGTKHGSSSGVTVIVDGFTLYAAADPEG